MSKPIRKTFVFNFILIILIAVVAYWIFFAFLGVFTNHGKELKVPNLMGMQADEAIANLENLGFHIDIDSTFNASETPLTILDQQPEAGQSVKKGRTIFLVINKVNPPDIEMPNLVSLSFRSAEMLLESNNLKLGDTFLIPDLAKGAILKQLYKGNEIAPGVKIPQGSIIDLVIGDGLGNVDMAVPDLIGMTYPEAIALLSSSNLNYTVLFDGLITDTMTAVVYVQAPTALDEMDDKNRIVEGDVIDFRVKQTISSHEEEGDNPFK